MVRPSGLGAAVNCCSVEGRRIKKKVLIRFCLLGQESLRRSETRLAEEGDHEDDVALTMVHLEQQDGQYTLQATNDAFLDDWNHRGGQLAWMCHYVYAMYVKVVPRSEGELEDHFIPFLDHYKKAAGFVQVLECSPRVPYMVGFTMPTRSGDAATNALYHCCLMKPGKLCNGNCADVEWLSGHVLLQQHSITDQMLFGHTQPSKRIKQTRGERRFVEAWRAWDALQLTRAERAWMKLKAEKRVPVLQDVTPYRAWYLPACAEETMIQVWLLPWLRGGFRHVYRGPWREKRQGTTVNPKYTRRQFLSRHPSGLALLPALPHSVAVQILRLVGNVKTDQGEMLIIADEESMRRRACENLAETTPLIFTGTGVHLQQLFPEEFGASITVEVSWNMDLLAEARKRPRPNAVNVCGDDDEDIVGGHVPGRVEEDFDGHDDQESEYDAVVEQPYSEERGLQYRPHVEVQDADVLEFAHRLSGWKEGRGWLGLGRRDVWARKTKTGIGWTGM